MSYIARVLHLNLDIQEVEKVLNDLQNSYINVENRIKEDMKHFKDEMRHFRDEMNNKFDFTSNQMNITGTEVLPILM